MEQFRLAGEALGSIKALMVFQDETSVNQRQCILLVDAFDLAFRSVAQEMRIRLRFDEKLTKWKALEHPLRELHRIFREGEQYVRQCLEPRDWWGKAMALNQNTECIDVHLHDLLWCLFVVIEAIENVGEITGTDHEDLNKKKLVLSKKYEREWMDPKLFQLKFGKLYLASQDLCGRIDAAWKEDRWMLSETIAEKRRPGSSKPLSKHESRLADVLVSPKGKIFPCSVLTGSSDYQLRRKFGPANSYKEVQWLGESFAVKHVIREIEPLMPEIALLSSISHPNVVHYLYCFADEEKKECFVVMELMSKDLSTYTKEVSSARRKPPFALLVAVDTMIQIARGMEYLHSKNIYHGELNPSNILVRPRIASPDGNLHVKVSGFGLAPIKNFKSSSNQVSAVNPCTWYAPEVLLEMERSGGDGIGISKCTDKADVYSFAMISFELLTGKVPFEDNRLQGDKTSKNIRVGERPLFPFPLPKYLTDLTRRCWHTDPSQRPSFSSICRILRYTKRFLIMNPDHSQPNAPVPPVDYYDIEMSLSRRFANSGVSEIPFQMYAYRVIEREKLTSHFRERNSDSGSEGTASLCSDESAGSAPLDSVKSAPFACETNRTPTRRTNGMFNKLQGQQQQRARSLMQSQLASPRQSLRTNSEKVQKTLMSSRRRMAGHAYVSDSELT
ncbi:serine/threonine-protein kinase ULK2-like [Zingiber officinale]|uniref:serine/threonine-protein kinase ULK2-like n=1 Tax=Zingiber officinale TaxID=94328 RepID=UPI001C4C9579|nr:serine/threonine-protein kinase ULK2-like [Zingiber officinale]